MINWVSFKMMFKVLSLMLMLLLTERISIKCFKISKNTKIYLTRKILVTNIKILWTTEQVNWMMKLNNLLGFQMDSISFYNNLIALEKPENFSTNASSLKSRSTQMRRTLRRLRISQMNKLKFTKMRLQELDKNWSLATILTKELPIRLRKPSNKSPIISRNSLILLQKAQIGRRDPCRPLLLTPRKRPRRAAKMMIFSFLVQSLSRMWALSLNKEKIVSRLSQVKLSTSLLETSFLRTFPSLCKPPRISMSSRTSKTKRAPTLNLSPNTMT